MILNETWPGGNCQISCYLASCTLVFDNCLQNATFQTPIFGL